MFINNKERASLGLHFLSSVAVKPPTLGGEYKATPIQIPVAVL